MDIRLNQPYSFTQLGRRANQEDSRYPDCDTPKDPQPFFVVCDGVGGKRRSGKPHRLRRIREGACG